MKNFHQHFKLNGNSFKSVNEILEYAKLMPVGVDSFLSDWFNKYKSIIVQTSGSTGTPKKIELKKESFINSAIATGTFFNLKENTTALMCLSPTYIAGKMMLVRAMVLGWDLDVVEAVSNPLIRTNNKYDFCAMVPMQAAASLQQLNSINTLIIGGGAISKSLRGQLQHLKTNVYATYGMTETITHIAVKKINHNDKKNYYSLLPNIAIKKDKRGCLVVNAPTISDSEIVTNDLVEIVNSSHFKWLGRYDTVINSGGIKLIPEQIEERLAALISERFFVAGVPDEVLGQKLIVIIEKEIKQGFNKLKNKEELKSNIQKLGKLTNYEIPKEIYFLSNFVETTTKKIQRNKTLDLLKL